jgi:hypothetical protein
MMLHRALLIVGLYLTPALLVGASSIENVLGKAVNEFQFEGGRKELWQDQLIRLCRKANVPCGIEILSNDRMEGRDKRMLLKDTSVATLLDLIVSQYPNYRWSIEDGVVNVLPQESVWKKMYRLFTGRPMDKRIAKLDIEDWPLETAAFGGICPKAGVECRISLAISVMGPGPRGKSVPIRRQGPKRNVSLHLTDISFRGALNELVRQDGHSVWLFYDGRTNNNLKIIRQ